MSGTISFNPYTTNVPANPFLLQTQGYISGFAVDDPTSRLWLSSGVLASTETIPMWGGVPISEVVNSQLPQNLGSNYFPTAAAGSELLGPAIKRATTQATVTGFSVFNQAAHMVLTPGSNSVPLASVYNSVHFYRLGTNARIVVPCASALVSAISGLLVNETSVALNWDPNAMQLTNGTPTGYFALPATVRLLSVNTNSKIVSWSSPNATWTTGDAAVILI